MHMLRKDLINQVCAELSLQKQDVDMAVNILLDTITQALAKEQRVEIRGFGSFSIRKRKSRCTKNPKTGTIMDIPERNTLHFTMSKSLKESLISEKE